MTSLVRPARGYLYLFRYVTFGVRSLTSNVHGDGRSASQWYEKVVSVTLTDFECRVSDYASALVLTWLQAL
jgi:hypothetical protein